MCYSFQLWVQMDCNWIIYWAEAHIRDTAFPTECSPGTWAWWTWPEIYFIKSYVRHLNHFRPKLFSRLTSGSGIFHHHLSQYLLFKWAFSCLYSSLANHHYIHLDSTRLGLACLDLGHETWKCFPLSVHRARFYLDLPLFFYTLPLINLPSLPPLQNYTKLII